MIIKKPYAFLIKHFRIIHLTLALLLLYVAYRTAAVFTFFNDYVRNGYYTLSSQTGSFINLYMFLAVVMIIVISSFIYLLMKWKDKSRLYYVSLCLFYFVVFLGFLVYFNVLGNIFNTNWDVRVVRAYRDIISILYFPQFIFLIIASVRAIGFDVKKFDFKKDLEELDIAEEDQEEIEVTFGENSYKYKRKLRRIFREIKYYALENKFFFGVICGVLVLVVFFSIYMNVSLFSKQFDESEFFSVNGVIFKVENSYVSDVDLSGKVINDGFKYVIVKVNMENGNDKRINIDTEDLRLMLDDNMYFPTFTRNEYFKDLGEGWYKNDTLYAGESYQYLLIYEVPKDIKFKEAIFRLVDNISVIDGELSAKYKDVKLDLKEYELEDESEYYSMGEGVSLEDSTLGKSEVVINSFQIGDSFTEYYEYCVNTCYQGKKLIKADTLGVRNRTILKLNLELVLEDDLYYSKYLKSNSDFINTFGSITYMKDGVETEALMSVKTLDIDTDNVYIEVPSELKNTNIIRLHLTIRNKSYVINLTK